MKAIRKLPTCWTFLTDGKGYCYIFADAPQRSTVARLRTADDRFAKVFAALGEPDAAADHADSAAEPICEQMYNVIEIAEELGLTQPTISHHLKILSEAGLVQCRRQCNSLYFYVIADA